MGRGIEFSNVLAGLARVERQLEGKLLEISRVGEEGHEDSFSEEAMEHIIDSSVPQSEENVDVTRAILEEQIIDAFGSQWTVESLELIKAVPPGAHFRALRGAEG